jgi:hypothetical protein
MNVVADDPLHEGIGPIAVRSQRRKPVGSNRFAVNRSESVRAEGHKLRRAQKPAEQLHAVAQPPDILWV